MTDTRPSVLFVCVHNAGRSQMAAGYLRHLAGDRVEVRSAGSQPADRVNPKAVEAMAEEGIDLTAEQPKVLTADAVQTSDVVITMGCGDACPYYPGTRYEDWELEDPAGRDLAAVRAVRARIRAHVVTLLAELLPGEPSAARAGEEAGQRDPGGDRECAASAGVHGQLLAWCPRTGARGVGTLFLARPATARSATRTRAVKRAVRRAKTTKVMACDRQSSLPRAAGSGSWA